MLIKINNDQCSIFFGNAELCPVSYHDPEQFKTFYNGLRQELGLSHIIFQRQVHGTDGWVITGTQQLTGPIMKEEREGDYLINTVAGVGIGVLTADCLPIIFYAPKHNVVAAAHAGWRSAVAGIGPKVIADLQAKFGIPPTDIHVYFGACAKVCCYEVGNDWASDSKKPARGEEPTKALANGGRLESIRAVQQNIDQSIVTRDSKLYFNNPGFNKSLLIAAGVPAANINDQYNDCTICNHQYHSYRRTVNKKHYDVQATIVWFKNN